MSPSTCFDHPTVQPQEDCTRSFMAFLSYISISILVDGRIIFIKENLSSACLIFLREQIHKNPQLWYGSACWIAAVCYKQFVINICYQHHITKPHTQLTKHIMLFCYVTTTHSVISGDAKCSRRPTEMQTVRKNRT
jgi:hypothetical protein